MSYAVDGQPETTVHVVKVERGSHSGLIRIPPTGEMTRSDVQQTADRCADRRRTAVTETHSRP
jgi:hypothetical protein